MQQIRINPIPKNKSKFHSFTNIYIVKRMNKAIRKLKKQ